MAYYQISISDEQLHGLLQGDRGLADLVQAVLNQVLQAQATDCLKAEPYQRTEERLGYRNGVRDRSLTTRVGSITLEVPQFRGQAAGRPVRKVSAQRDGTHYHAYGDGG